MGTKGAKLELLDDEGSSIDEDTPIGYHIFLPNGEVKGLLKCTAVVIFS